jgi:hypothetical protein
MEIFPRSSQFSPNHQTIHSFSEVSMSKHTFFAALTISARRARSDISLNNISNSCSAGTSIEDRNKRDVLLVDVHEISIYIQIYIYIALYTVFIFVYTIIHNCISKAIINGVQLPINYLPESWESESLGGARHCM